MASRNTEQPVFETVDVTIGSITYTLRELTAGEYDECLNVATKPDGDVDMVMMVKLMLIKSIESPRLSDVQLASLPYKASRALKREVSRLHWSEEQEETAEAAEQAEDDERSAGPNP